MHPSLKKQMERLEQEAALRAAKREQDFWRNLSEVEMLFQLVHSCHPEKVEDSDLPHTRQFTYNGVRATITLERVK